MKVEICPKCNGNEIKKGIMGASFGQVHMYPENQRGPSSPISANYCHDLNNPENI